MVSAYFIFNKGLTINDVLGTQPLSNDKHPGKQSMKKNIHILLIAKTQIYNLPIFGCTEKNWNE